MPDTNEYLEKTKSYYNKRFGRNTENVGKTEEEILRWRKIEKEIVRIQRREKQTSFDILDFGCGSGWMSKHLMSFGNVTGVDASDKAIEAAKKRYPGISFLSFNAAEPAGLDEKFDIVVSSEVVEHVLNQKGYFENIYRLLKNGGYLVLTTPNGKWKSDYFISERKTWAQPYELWLTPDELKKMAGSLLSIKRRQSFYSKWIFRIDNNKAVFNLLGAIGVFRPFRYLGFSKLFGQLLDLLGFGIYQLLVCKKEK